MAAYSGAEPMKARIAETPPPPHSKSRTSAVLSSTKKSQKHGHHRQQRLNRFVRLSQRILEGSLICRDEFEFTGTALDPRLNGCLAIDHHLKWAFATEQEPPIEFTEHPFVDEEENEIHQQLVIQPLGVQFVGPPLPFDPFFTPLGKKISLSGGEVTQGVDAWLFAQDWLSEQKSGNAFDHLLTGDAEAGSTPLCYRYDMDQNSAVIAGVGYIYDIGDTTGMSQAFARAGYDTAEKVGAVNLTLGYSYSDFTLTGGYIHAIEERDSLTNSSATGQENDPTAWNSQLAYRTRFLDHPAVFAVGYQKSSETLGHYLPEERYTTKASIFLRRTTTLSLEYYQDREYSGVDGLGDDDAYGITTKLGYRF